MIDISKLLTFGVQQGASDCHARGGRLNGLPGIYVPASHPNGLLDKLGWGLALLVLLGVSGHGLLRVLSSGKTTGATK